MMRSMYSAVSGLKTHQTKMDVIGNNIANVNTVAFKSSSVTFQDILYQTTSNASGANVATGLGGVNAKQIGLGVTTAATKLGITSAGAAETTGDPFDIRLSDSNSTNFFIVNNGKENLFTRSGSFYVDGAGNLCMTSTGYTVMGWQVDPTTRAIRKDTVSPLHVMAAENQTSAPEPTTNATCSGVIDRNDTDVVSDAGMIMNLNFYDKLGYAYTARFAVRKVDDNGNFTVSLNEILDSNSQALFSEKTATNAQVQALFGSPVSTPHQYQFNSPAFQQGATAGTIEADDGTGTYVALAADTTSPNAGKVGYYQYTDATGATRYVSYVDIFSGFTADMLDRMNFVDAAGNPAVKAALSTNGTNGITTDTNGNPVLEVIDNTISTNLLFSPEDGTFSGIGTAGVDNAFLNLASSGLFPNGNFENIDIDFSKTQNTNNGGKSTAGMDSGDTDGTTGKGKKLGALIGLSVSNNGEIYGTYDNGNTELLCQIAVAQFANASGLEKVGDNCYNTTLNSGEFDGIGVDVTADGSKMTSGELEMSNVDLSTEFTQMITTQRGFQANSRVITTSDTLLEELVNLKR